MFDQPARKRPQLSPQSQLLAVTLGILCVIIVMGAIRFEFHFGAAQCPILTFHHGMTGSGGSIVAATLVGVPSLVALPCFIGARFNIWTYGEGYTAPSRRKRRYTVPIIVSALGVATAAAFGFNGANYYDCVGASGVIVRSGYLANPRHLAWSDLRTVYGWCWTAQPRGRPPYKGATLDLQFGNGVKIPFGLVDGGRVLTQDYLMLKSLLAGRNYQYYVNSTVTPEACPAGLFPVLWSWHSDN